LLRGHTLNLTDSRRRGQRNSKGWITEHRERAAALRVGQGTAVRPIVDPRHLPPR
jgi:hypothetical protein